MKSSTQIGVGAILNVEVKGKVDEVIRKSDRVILVNLILED